MIENNIIENNEPPVVPGQLIIKYWTGSDPKAFDWANFNNLPENVTRVSIAICHPIIDAKLSVKICESKPINLFVGNKTPIIKLLDTIKTSMQCACNELIHKPDPDEMQRLTALFNQLITFIDQGCTDVIMDTDGEIYPINEHNAVFKTSSELLEHVQKIIDAYSPYFLEASSIKFQSKDRS